MKAAGCASSADGAGASSAGAWGIGSLWEGPAMRSKSCPIGCLQRRSIAPRSSVGLMPLTPPAQK
eukprot:167762-Pleurochrysis_carterae.AAC.1